MKKNIIILVNLLIIFKLFASTECYDYNKSECSNKSVTLCKKKETMPNFYNYDGLNWKILLPDIKKGIDFCACDSCYKLLSSKLSLIIAKGDLKEIKKIMESEKIFFRIKKWHEWSALPPEKKTESRSSDEYRDILPEPSMLLVAARFGYYEVFKYLLENGMSAKNEKYNSILSETAYGGNINILNDLISKGFDIDKYEDENGVPLLSWAAYGGSIKMFKELVKRGKNIKVIDNNMRSVLHYAVMSQDTKIVRHVLSIADNDMVFLKDDKNRTALDYAKILQNSIIEEILRNYTPEKPKSSGCLPNLF